MVPFAIPVLIIAAGSGEKNLQNIIRVIPISRDIEYQLKGESLALDNTNPLNHSLLLEIFNERPMLAGNLGKYLGSVSASDLKSTQAVRNQFLTGKIAKPDKDYLDWKQKEIKLTEYLTFPVNAALWEAEHEHEIELVLFRKAADTLGLELSKIKPHRLMKTDEFSLWIIQKRDEALLRFISDKIKPGNIEINAREKTMSREKSGIYQNSLGCVRQLPEYMKIKFSIKRESIVFNLRFIIKQDK